MNESNEKMFKLFDDFLIAEKILSQSKPTDDSDFKRKVQKSFDKIQEQLDIELDKIAANAPEFNKSEGS